MTPVQNSITGETLTKSDVVPGNVIPSEAAGPTRNLRKALRERVLVLDGAMGTMIQRHNLTEEDFRGRNADGEHHGASFADSAVPLAGCNDLLVLTRPDVIGSIHEAYLQSGADIISTNTFNANAISLADYGLTDHVYQINRTAAELARAAADRFETPSRPRFVAGSMGPTNRTAALAANADDPAARDVTFSELADAYYEQARGLMDGGADLLLVETVFDTLNAKAALFAISRLNEERASKTSATTPAPNHNSLCVAKSAAAGAARMRPDHENIPVMVSGTIAGASGRTLSGQTVEAFYTSLAPYNPLSVGLNCAFGARQMLPWLERLSEEADAVGRGCFVSAHPNAGLPNLSGGYDETPEMFAADVEEFLQRGLVGIVGGCCGTTPEHTRLLAALAARHTPRKLPENKHITVLSGLEPLTITPESNFINIGERANVSGSARFARLIREERWDEAISVARDQVMQGAQIVDVCMDDGMIDGVSAMRRFLLMAAAEPELSRVPWMIDSSSWEVIEAGLQCVQGKCIVNSISLKEGPAEFLRRARLVRRYSAATVVMLFDERGQADTFARKIEVAERAYKLLTDNGFPPEDIIFDPNVLTIATGIPEHDRYAVDFIEATRWIKQNLPHTRVSAGVSNLSFSFRGIGVVREAMHSVFLYHARRAGLDMGIVNADTLQIYSEIEPHLLELVEDAVLCRRPDATERLTIYASELKAAIAAGVGAVAGGTVVGSAITGAAGMAGSTATGTRTGTSTAAAPQRDNWRELPVNERIRHAVLKGMDDHITADAIEAMNELGAPISVINNLLMPAMGEVGELFGEGKMFLPQVVRSARVMRRAVDALNPYISSENTSRKPTGRLLLATVRGDVHDIGKNIVRVVASTAGWEVIDLGVMVEAEKIADESVRNNITIIGLSGLITPSLDEMIRTVRELDRRGIRIPVLIGGATTSRLHTAVKIAPEYGGVVIHSRDASENVRIMSELTGPNSENFIAGVRAQQATDRDAHSRTVSGRNSLSLSEARRRAHHKSADMIAVPNHIGRVVFSDHPISEVEPYINWSMFYAAWQLCGNESNGLEAGTDNQKTQLREDAEKLLARIKNEHLLRLEGVAGVFPARRGRRDEHPNEHLDEQPNEHPNEQRQVTVPSTANSTPIITDDIVVIDPCNREISLPQFRNHDSGEKINLSVADYVTYDKSYEGTQLQAFDKANSTTVAEVSDREISEATSIIKNNSNIDPAAICSNSTTTTSTDETTTNISSDYIGAFALTAGVGLSELTERLRAEGDEYNAIMAKLLADRLTEAFAEFVHEFIRRVAWGFQKDENGVPVAIEPQEAIRGKYHGKRFAFGYPATPDHSLKKEVFELLGVMQTTSMTLTDSYMISPGESLCGLIVADADARYFTLGPISDEQIDDYARRRGTTPENIRKLIGKM
ncbi:MAG: homocysteine S-methyltransferase family protein [Alistipes sp.]|jgi:5-methyltetrahydrofolate--homocysteine methyltransferase|nr:homocysteine S-methyltransferase family protein [Alistipes sp.]